jgi:hypothetical protein
MKKVIGNPIKSGNLEIAEHDFPTQMTWHEAKSACAALGDCWRLPTKEELNELYSLKDEIGGFADAYYWSSNEYYGNNAWIQYFFSGNQNANLKYAIYSVRAVR